jgi:protein AbiQ
MGKLKFYDIDTDYIKYLKKFDEQIPDVTYDRYNKFFCGIVLQINGFKYFAPVSSFNKQQRTNFVIRDKGRPISSIRFSFMFPAFNHVLKLKDFSNEKQSYKDLVNAEIKYCNQNVDTIYKIAKKVYKIGTKKNHPLNYTCCDFKLLEEKSLDYSYQLSKTTKQIAATNEDLTTI